MVEFFECSFQEALGGVDLAGFELARSHVASGHNTSSAGHLPNPRHGENMTPWLRGQSQRIVPCCECAVHRRESVPGDTVQLDQQGRYDVDSKARY